MSKKPTVATRRALAIARRFPENGMKLLLEHPLNVHDLLQFTESPLIPAIDFAGLKRVGTTFVQRDYRHVECDVVLTAPFRPLGSSRGSKRILVYVLIEHQSLPEEVMILRVLEYVVQIYKYQEREWLRRHGSGAGIRLSPVLPVVFYTGTRRWDDLGSLSDLVELGELFGPLVPALKPLFINLSGLAAERLVSAGGFFGRLLHLVQQREAPAATFAGLAGKRPHGRFASRRACISLSLYWARAVRRAAVYCVSSCTGGANLLRSLWNGLLFQPTRSTGPIAIISKALFSSSGTSRRRASRSSRRQPGSRRSASARAACNSRSLGSRKERMPRVTAVWTRNTLPTIMARRRR
jgi:hypothetical protein